MSQRQLDPRRQNTPTEPSFVHPSANVSSSATIGQGCAIWRLAQVREHAVMGAGCIIGAAVYVGAGVHLGDNCKVQNQALLYEGLTLERGVFVGPRVCFTNDLLPRAVNPDGSRKVSSDWTEGKTLVREGASIGAGSVIITGITIGRWAMVGAGSVITRNVPDHALAFGNPARLRGWVCRCARRLDLTSQANGRTSGHCAACDVTVELDLPAP